MDDYIKEQMAMALSIEKEHEAFAMAVKMAFCNTPKPGDLWPVGLLGNNERKEDGTETKEDS